MSDFAIETDRLTRYFGQRAAVLDVSMRVPRGCVFALLGRNGSGKSTTLRMLLGLLAPTRGSARVLEFDSTELPPEARARIGYMAEGHPLIPWMRLGDLEKFQRDSFPRWNARIFAQILAHFRLHPGTKASDISRGERAGVSLALTLAPEPELILLDEPALGLDPIARRGLLEVIVQLTRDRTRTIVFSSHLLADVERVADQIAILDGSVLRAQCPIETFRQKVVRYALRFASPRAIPDLPAIPGLLRAVHDHEELRLTVVNGNAATQAMLASLQADEFEELPLDLEEAFLDYLDGRGEMRPTFQLPEHESRPFAPGKLR